ncbi:MAG: DUF1553 domain-containing protein [Zavarzinella sp.]
MRTIFLAVLVIASLPRWGWAADFRTDVVPMLTRLGCNSGACHGAAAGRGGFHLSLFGSNPKADFKAIVHDLEGRRIHHLKPEESLILKKPTGDLPHEGGELIKADSFEEKLLLQWLADGASYPKTEANLKKISLNLSHETISLPNQAISFDVIAHFADGKTKNVSSLVQLTADQALVKIDLKQRTITPQRRGVHLVVARYLDLLAVVQIVVPYSDQQIVVPKTEKTHWIDDEIYKQLVKLGIPPNGQTGNHRLVRRIYLDLTGTLPTTEEIEQFVSSKDTAKRKKLIDRLLQSPEYVDFWTYKWATWLQIRPFPNDEQCAITYHQWLREQIRSHRGWDRVARDLMLATGDSHVQGPANFTRMARDARTHAEQVGRVFMGVRLECANCHDHPLDRWTQDDYHGLAAVFAKMERGQTVRVATRGEVTNLRTGMPAIPKLPGAEFLASARDPREPLATWLLAADNPYFAKSIVNRIWKELMGRGLVEPVDDLRATNPATHPELLTRLASEFQQDGYQLPHLIRKIMLSQAYSRSSEISTDNRLDDRFYSRYFSKPLWAETYLDCVQQATQTLDGKAPTKRQIQTINVTVPDRSLDILGRCNRADSCTEGAVSTGLTTNLHLINGKAINARISDPNGFLQQQFATKTPTLEIVKALYLRTLCRPPTETEQAFWQQQLPQENQKLMQEILEDLFWSLLCSREFRNNS